MTNNQKWLIGGIAAILLACLCFGSLCLAFGGLAYLNNIRQTNNSGPGILVTKEVIPVEPNQGIPEKLPTSAATTAAPETNSPAPLATPQAAQATAESQTPASQDAKNTLNTLEQVVVPINDPRELARRLEGKQNIPETLPAPNTPYQVGASQTFWASNTDTNANFQVQARLRYVTNHLYFWVEDSVSYNQAALARLADTFETKIYPTDREFFGSEWTPGIDNDVHLYVLYASGLGNGIAGYFSSADELPPQVHQYSNAHEMFMVNADTTPLDDPYVYQVMAHEFQHMIHWYDDRNEQSWLNEGFSELAGFLNGYAVGGADSEYVSNPDLQLTDWPSPPESGPHYGESFLFLSYFLDRFGDMVTKAVVAAPDNGLDSIDKVLTAQKQTDPQTGKPVQADDVFQDWTVTSYINNPSAGDGRYAYKRYQNAPTASATEDINSCTPDSQMRTVHQYGVDYIRISCSGNYTLKFQGSTEVGVLPESAHSGKYAFWSNKGDELDMTLSQTFDLTQVSGPVTFNYQTWYDLEKDYDYLYLEASADGSTWQILKTPSGRAKAEDPSGNAYGWGYNGKSSGWIDEKVDLSQFAGKKVQLRFEYITDAAVNGEGFLLDDVSIPAINYAEDFENGDGGWQSSGFVRIQNRLPQTFRVALIQEGRTVSVQDVTLDGTQSASIPLQFDRNTSDVVLVVSGTTRFTTQEASYQFSFQK